MWHRKKHCWQQASRMFGWSKIMQVVKAGVAWGLFAEILSQCTGCITRNDYCGILLGPWLDPHGFDSQWQKPFVLSESFEPWPFCKPCTPNESHWIFAISLWLTHIYHNIKIYMHIIAYIYICCIYNSCSCNITVSWNNSRTSRGPEGASGLCSVAKLQFPMGKTRF